MVAVRIAGVEKSFAETAVLQGIDIDIADGQFVVLVGSSGCGKSTLLRMIAGLDRPSGGDILIDDVVVTDAAPGERDIAMVFQSYALYPHMTVRENMAFALRQRRLPAAEIAARLDEAARMLGLEALLDRFPKDLSGGQRQRVAMGRAVVRHPKVFLFDEPLSNLDAKLRVRMRAEIKALHRRLGATVIYVTHDQIEAMTMGDRIVLMHGGRIAQQGRPLDLYDRPSTRYVAEFIGSPAMNVLRGRVEAAGDGLGLRLRDGLRLPLGEAARPLLGQEVDCGVRPEHVRLDPGGVQALVDLVEPMGSETQVSLRYGEAEIVCLLRDRVEAEPGATLPVAPDVGRMHFFSVETGRRLL